MFFRLLFLGIVFIVSNGANAAQRSMVNFELLQDQQVQNHGYVLVSEKLKAWNKGLQTSYLKLQCKPLPTGKTEKLLSTVNLFDGLRVTHQKLNGSIVLTVELSKVKPRLVEIRKLSAGECIDLAPILTKTVETYKIADNKGTESIYTFGQSMQVKLSVN